MKRRTTSLSLRLAAAAVTLILSATAQANEYAVFSGSAAFATGTDSFGAGKLVVDQDGVMNTSSSTSYEVIIPVTRKLATATSIRADIAVADYSNTKNISCRLTNTNPTSGSKSSNTDSTSINGNDTLVVTLSSPYDNGGLQVVCSLAPSYSTITTIKITEYQ